MQIPQGPSHADSTHLPFPNFSNLNPQNNTSIIQPKRLKKKRTPPRYGDHLWFCFEEPRTLLGCLAECEARAFCGSIDRPNIQRPEECCLFWTGRGFCHPKRVPMISIYNFIYIYNYIYIYRNRSIL